MSQSQENDVVIGLEIHIQLTNLNTKLFCSCSSNYRDAEPNSHTCPICLGLPGALPVINEKALEFATRLALALEGKINRRMYFFRKHYFYPDLPKNFQITQYNKAGGKAFADGGKITIKIDGKKRDLPLDRIHLEEDPGRLIHKGSIATSPYTLVDYNRSGITLIEIVTKPVMRSPEEAREFLNQLKSIVQYIEIADLDLEGSCRVDANISIKGYKRSEVKNISSFKEVERALKWEIQRQRNLIKRGKEIKQETRHWDDVNRITIALRTKEFEKDYRYFPEQDLVPIEIDDDFIDTVEKNLPELPNQRMNRLQEEYSLSEFDAELLVIDKHIADFYEKGVQKEPSFGKEEYKQFCNWLMSDISRWLNEHDTSIQNTELKPNELAKLIKYINSGKITGKIAKTFVADLMKGKTVDKIIEDTGKKRIADEDKLSHIVQEVIEENEDIVKDYRKNPKALQALIGRVMKKTRGQADPLKTKDLMLDYLEE
ncbi:MAG: Asp-tRNA(Asn)/Glu-tRNA(Gln) amidotransferase subunit GatB [Promethearchaeia archaeon]